MSSSSSSKGTLSVPSNKGWRGGKWMTWVLDEREGSYHTNRSSWHICLLVRTTRLEGILSYHAVNVHARISQGSGGETHKVHSIERKRRSINHYSSFFHHNTPIESLYVRACDWASRTGRTRWWDRKREVNMTLKNSIETKGSKRLR